MANVSSATEMTTARTQLPVNVKLIRTMFIPSFFVLGIIGSLLALFILRCKGNKKNKKYKLMLRYLLTIDAIGLMGMLTQLVVEKTVTENFRLKYKYYSCVAFVIWRLFGLCSGCVAAIMAGERCLALVRPFFYHKHVTVTVIRRALLALCSVAMFITLLPFIGFGQFYDPALHKCVRYRDAITPLNEAYAYLFGAFGVFICGSIVTCNVAVIRVLYLVRRKRTVPILRHQISHTSQSSQTESLTRKPSGFNVTTTAVDEIRFAKLMIVLSVSFVVCWMTQMITIPMARLHLLPNTHWFFLLADIFLAVHFTLDPYFYVLFRCKDPRFFDCIKKQLNKQNSRTTIDM